MQKEATGSGLPDAVDVQIEVEVEVEAEVEMLKLKLKLTLKLWLQLKLTKLVSWAQQQVKQTDNKTYRRGWH